MLDALWPRPFWSGRIGGVLCAWSKRDGSGVGGVSYGVNEGFSFTGRTNALLDDYEVLGDANSGHGIDFL